jgi:phage terminase large subunit GpA-like protein
VIDRFDVRKSQRLDPDGERLWVKPSTYPEDWDELIEEVMEKRYPLETGDGHMSIAHTFCDSGGTGRSHTKKAGVEEIEGRGVTSNAYNFWRKLKKDGKHDRFTLVKGDANRGAPRAALTYPDAERSDRSAGARGEIPVLRFNVNSLKDTLNGMLDRKDAGGGKIDFPSWLPRSWFEELVSEVMTTQGWEKIGSRRNEAWDLLTYCLGSLVWKRLEKVNWSEPPPWLAPWPDNPRITWEDKKQGSVDKKKNKSDIWADLGAELS